MFSWYLDHYLHHSWHVRVVCMHNTKDMHKCNNLCVLYIHSTCATYSEHICKTYTHVNIMLCIFLCAYLHPKEAHFRLYASHTHTQIHTYTNTHIHTYTHAHAHGHMFVLDMHIHVCPEIYVCVRTYTHIVKCSHRSGRFV